MNTTLDPWDIIGWLLLGTAALAVVAVILILLVMWQRHLLTQYLIRRDWRRTRHVAPPAEIGKDQIWGYNHGESYKKGVKVRRHENGTLALLFEEGFTWGGKTDLEWAAVRDQRRYTLISISQYEDFYGLRHPMLYRIQKTNSTTLAGLRE